MCDTHLLVLGATGTVGAALMQHFPTARIVGSCRQQKPDNYVAFDLEKHAPDDLLRAAIEKLPTGCFSHCALSMMPFSPAACAAEPAKTRHVAVTRMNALIDTLQAAKIVPVFFSTDYVFDGSAGLSIEATAANPITEYGRQKYLVEQHLAASGAPHLILRLGKVVSVKASAGSLIHGWVKDIDQGNTIRIASDQILGPVSVDDVAAVTKLLTARGATGLYHVSNGEQISRYEFFRRTYFHLTGRDDPDMQTFVPCPLAEIGFSETYPQNTSLDNHKTASELDFEFMGSDVICRQAIAGLHGKRGKI